MLLRILKHLIVVMVEKFELIVNSNHSHSPPHQVYKVLEGYMLVVLIVLMLVLEVSTNNELLLSNERGREQL